MNLEKTAAIGELVSSVAIVLTLGYLAVQTQQTNNAMRANSREATMLADVTLLSASLGSPELMSGSNPAVDPATQYLRAYMRIREFAWFQYENGILDDSSWGSYMSPTVRILRTEGGQDFWARTQSEFDTRFVAHVDQLLAEDAP